MNKLPIPSSGAGKTKMNKNLILQIQSKEGVVR
jgi:hypothetical protein